MNTKLLRKVQAQILKEPRQFHMENWYTSKTWWNIPNCGTAACIGGWAMAIAQNRTPREMKHAWWPDKYALLGLEMKPANLLFNEDEWPKRFRGGRTVIIRAKRAAARIEHFIKTNGRE